MLTFPILPFRSRYLGSIICREGVDSDQYMKIRITHPLLIGFVSQITNVMLEVVEKVSKTPTRDEIITFIIIKGFCEKKTPF